LTHEKVLRENGEITIYNLHSPNFSDSTSFKHILLNTRGWYSEPQYYSQ